MRKVIWPTARQDGQLHRRGGAGLPGVHGGVDRPGRLWPGQLVMMVFGDIAGLGESAERKSRI